MIDTNRPLQLSDGQPVTFVRMSRRWIVIKTSRRLTSKGGLTYSAGSHFCFEPEGPHAFGSFGERLQNVPTATGLDLSKPLRTREGLAVTFVTMDPANKGIIVEVTRFGGKFLERRNIDGTVTNTRRTYGKVSYESPDDVINKVADSVQFFNVYTDGRGATAHHTLQNAKDRSKVGKTRIGIIEVFLQDGVPTHSKYYPSEPYKRASGYETSKFRAQLGYPSTRASVAAG